MKVEPGYNSQDKLIVISVESRLFEKYFSNFNGMFQEKSGTLPEGATLEQDSSNADTIRIQFPVPKDSRFKQVDDERMAVSIRSSDLDAINDIIDAFTNSAVRHELRQTEFIPLEGYELENLQKDILGAVENKRNLCIIKDYQEYLDMSKNSYIFNQVSIDYGSEDYVDAILMIYSGKLNELKEKWSNQLKKTEWF